MGPGQHPPHQLPFLFGRPLRGLLQINMKAYVWPLAINI